MNFTGKIHAFAICCLALFLSAPAVAQQASSADPFAAYIGCTLPNGPQIIEVTPRAPGISARPVHTLTGTAAVNIDDGRRIRFGYSEQEPYANVDVESIPDASYAKSKAALIDNFEYVLASGDDVRNYKLKPKLNGFEIQGLDHRREVIRVSVHVISGGRLTGSTMPAPVNSNTAIAALGEKEHLTVPSIGVQRPTVRERHCWPLTPVFVVDRRTIFHCNCAHSLFS